MPYSKSLERLIHILNELREKCPWDQKQTIESLRPQTVEELYELNDAILEGDWENIKEELGDLLLHIVFYSKIAEEQGQFNLGAVLQSISNKLVARHPHIYSNLSVKDENEVKQNWEVIKLKEGKKSVLSGVPNSLPAITKALVIQRKVKQVGFEWDHVEDVKNKVLEEWKELESACQENDRENIEEELGDLLFSIVNYARFLKIDPEEALQKTNQKFKHRFQTMEDLVVSRGKKVQELSLTEMDILWEEIKRNC